MRIIRVYADTSVFGGAFDEEFKKPSRRFFEQVKSGEVALLSRSPKKPKTTTKHEAVFQPEFREDLRYWVETDRKTALRIFQLIEAINRDPFQGIGKPGPLKFPGSGVWSRRITQEHRLAYVVGHERIDFVQSRYHY